MHRTISASLIALALAASPVMLNAQTTTTPARRGTPPPTTAKPATPPAKPATPPARGATPAKPATPPARGTATATAAPKLPAGTPSGTYAIFVTSKGNFTAKLFPEDAPKTVANFIGLATGKKAWKNPRTGAMWSRPYYNNVLFHRVIPQFMIQGGDPLGTGYGGPGFAIPDEISPKYRFNRPGLLAMANSGPNTGGGQFFVTVAPYPSLDGGYTVFGEVIDGLPNAIAISQVPRGMSGATKDRPLTPVTLRSVTIETVK
jgi:peptidyl-prolyl cis-trans isomerase A (cyclophilin A)